MKRFRYPKPKIGQIKLQWGKLPHDNEDIICAWGGGKARKCDSRLIMNAFTSKTFKPGTYDAEPSLVDELKKRGYDIKTIKFSIEVKK